MLAVDVAGGEQRWLTWWKLRADVAGELAVDIACSGYVGVMRHASDAAGWTRMGPTWVDMAGSTQLIECAWDQHGSTWLVNIQCGSTWLTERAWGWHGLTWLLKLALPCEWKGEPRGIEIQARSVTYLMGLPLLGSSLIISDPSVAAYDFLRLAHIAERCVVSLWRGEV